MYKKIEKPDLSVFAEFNRKTHTEFELKSWLLLKNNKTGRKFRRQQQIGIYYS